MRAVTLEHPFLAIVGRDAFMKRFQIEIADNDEGRLVADTLAILADNGALEVSPTARRNLHVMGNHGDGYTIPLGNRSIQFRLNQVIELDAIQYEDLFEKGSLSFAEIVP